MFNLNLVEFYISADVIEMMREMMVWKMSKIIPGIITRVDFEPLEFVPVIS